MNQPKRIPYGLAHYGRLKRENCYYVDKTHFIPLVEAAPYFLFFIRPRRFGKTLWLSTLEHYYDVAYADQFEALFGDTYIGQNPTADRNSYLVLMLNFAMINPEVNKLEESFERYGRQIIREFVTRYADFFSQAEQETVLAETTFIDQLQQIFIYTAQKNLKTYLLIDEYDNFANTILTTVGEQAYHTLTHGGGFYRHFFNRLKGATTGRSGGLTRLFITGVSPLTLDDVSSGFNIGHNVTMSPRLNELVGFTKADVEELLTYFQQTNQLSLSVELCLPIMTQWYDNYCFAEEATTTMYNSDMVLYFLLKSMERSGLPKSLIDENIRIDYGKLRHLMLVDRRLNGNFSQLQEIIDTGEVISPINLSFPVSQLLQRENFISLLFYFGLLTVAGSYRDQFRLRIPNQTIKQLMYGYIREGFKDVEVFRLDVWRFSRLVGEMAYRGEWQAVFEFLSEQIRAQSSVRDYLHGEKMIQGFLVAYLNVTSHFLTWSEKEMGGGFVDIYLEPFIARYPEMQYGYLLELKYVPRQKFNETVLAEKITEAESQLGTYLADSRLTEVAQKTTLKGLALVYNGWELVHYGEVEVGS